MAKNKKTNDEETKQEIKTEKKHNFKVVKHATMSTIFTIMFLVVLVMVNIVATSVFDKYPLTIDLTENKKFSVSDTTIDYIENIDTDVKITVLCNEETFISINEYTQQANEVLKRYEKYNDKISVRYVDLISNPDLVSDYPDTDLANYDIIVETNTIKDGESFKRIKVIGILDLVSWAAPESYESEFDEAEFLEYISQLVDAYGPATVMSYYEVFMQASCAEQAFTSAIMNVTDPSPVTVTFLTGRTEATELTYFKKLLDANGYVVKTCDITKENIPEDTNLAVMPAPTIDYTSEEIKKVSDYLVNDGKLEKDLLYIASVSQSDTPNIDEFLEEYGVVVEKQVVVETDGNKYYNYPINAIMDIASENYKQDFTSTSSTICMSYIRPITTLFKEQGMSKTEAFLKSSSTSHSISADKIKDESFTFNDALNTNNAISKGAQNTMIIATKSAFEGESTNYSNILVVGSDYYFDDSLLQAAQFQNSEYIISILNGMTDKTPGVVITPKTIKANLYDLTESQKKILKWTFQAIIPLIVLVSGLVVYRRRKNR